MKLELKYLHLDGFDVGFDLVAWLLVVIGAGILWGWGGALIAAGAYWGIQSTADEITERFTLVRRGDPPKGSAHTGGMGGTAT